MTDEEKALRMLWRLDPSLVWRGHDEEQCCVNSPIEPYWCIRAEGHEGLHFTYKKIKFDDGTMPSPDDLIIWEDK